MAAGSSAADAIVPIEEVLLLPGVPSLATWEANDPLAQLPEALQQRLASLLDELKALYGPPSQAITDAERARNQLAVTQAEVAKTVAEAEGEARSAIERARGEAE